MMNFDHETQQILTPRTDMSRRNFVIGGSALGSAVLMPQRSDAFFQLLGPVLASMTLSLGVRFASRRLATTALNFGRNGLGVSLTKNIARSNKKMRSGRFTDFSKSEVNRSRITPTLGVNFYPLISTDKKNACTVFIPEKLNSGETGPPIMLEGPTVHTLLDSSSGVISKFGKGAAKSMLLPLSNKKTDISSFSSIGRRSTVFETNFGGCSIVTDSSKAPNDDGWYDHQCSIAFYDREARPVHRYINEVQMRVKA